MPDIFSIGHSNHSVAHLLGLLRLHGVTALADVRSQPYSRRYPQFVRENLARSLRDAGLAYVFLGEELGGKRPNMTLDAIAKTPLFARGLKRLRTGAETHRVAFMCAEREPLECHRTMLIARHLRRMPDLAIRHILADGSVETQDELERRLVKTMGVAPLPLLDDAADGWTLAVERAYEARTQGWNPRAAQ